MYIGNSGYFLIATLIISLLTQSYSDVSNLIETFERMGGKSKTGQGESTRPFTKEDEELLHNTFECKLTDEEFKGALQSLEKKNINPVAQYGYEDFPPLPTTHSTSARQLPPVSPLVADTYMVSNMSGGLEDIPRSVFDQIITAPMLSAGVSSYNWKKEFPEGLEPITPVKLAKAVLVITKLVEERVRQEEMKKVVDATLETQRLVESMRSEIETSVQLCNKNVDAINNKLSKTETKKVVTRIEPAQNSSLVRGMIRVFGSMFYQLEGDDDVYKKPSTSKVKMIIEAPQKFMDRVSQVDKFMGATAVRKFISMLLEDYND